MASQLRDAAAEQEEVLQRLQRDARTTQGAGRARRASGAVARSHIGTAASLSWLHQDLTYL